VTATIAYFLFMNLSSFFEGSRVWFGGGYSELWLGADIDEFSGLIRLVTISGSSKIRFMDRVSGL